MSRNNVNGFTLFELIIVLMIMSLLYFFAQSGLHNMLVRTQVNSDAYRFFLTLSFARQAAIKHNRLIMVCPTFNQTTCSDDWSDGYMVVHDQNILRYEKWHLGTTLANKQTPYIQFSGDGRSLQRATFVIQSSAMVKIVLYDSGRVRLVST